MNLTEGEEIFFFLVIFFYFFPPKKYQSYVIDDANQGSLNKEPPRAEGAQSRAEQSVWGWACRPGSQGRGLGDRWRSGARCLFKLCSRAARCLRALGSCATRLNYSAELAQHAPPHHTTSHHTPGSLSPLTSAPLGLPSFPFSTRVLQ